MKFAHVTHKSLRLFANQISTDKQSSNYLVHNLFAIHLLTLFGTIKLTHCIGYLIC